jgi:hypothetical protein
MLNVKTPLFENSFFSLFRFGFFISYFSGADSKLPFSSSFIIQKSPSPAPKRRFFPQQNDFRTFCMSDEAEKVNQKLEKIICTC